MPTFNVNAGVDVPFATVKYALALVTSVTVPEPPPEGQAALQSAPIQSSVAFTLPFTSSFSEGVDVPIPTFPPARMRTCSVLLVLKPR
ncbi:hypothetical protein D3C86_1917110 [compost metagenome]